MNHLALDALTRRATLAMVGATGLTAMTGVPSAAKNKRNRNKKARQKCKKQGQDCTAIFEAECSGDPECLDQTLPCCEFAGRCDYARFIACIEDEL